jgi:hypothetical protein
MSFLLRVLHIYACLKSLHRPYTFDIKVQKLCGALHKKNKTWIRLKTELFAGQFLMNQECIIFHRKPYSD